MILLPRALLALASGQPIPANRRGVLIPVERIGETDIQGAIVMVEIDLISPRFKKRSLPAPP